jgi:hypothetical protein
MPGFKTNKAKGFQLMPCQACILLQLKHGLAFCIFMLEFLIDINGCFNMDAAIPGGKPKTTARIYKLNFSPVFSLPHMWACLKLHDMSSLKARLKFPLLSAGLL